jgi:phosphoglycolate phosphatase
MIKAVIFDFDGTIADTFPTIVKLFNEIAEENGFPIITEKNLDEVRNHSAMELVKKYKVSPLRLLKFQKDFQKNIYGQIENIPIHKGITEMLNKLKKMGLIVGVVTSNSQENVEKFLKLHDISLDFVHSERNIFGKGVVLRKLIKLNKVSSDQVIYVGDEVRDIEAARGAKMKVAAVTWGMNSKERLEKAKPDYIVDNTPLIPLLI